MVESGGEQLLAIPPHKSAVVSVPLNAITITVSALIGGHSYSATMKGFMAPSTVPVGSHDSSSIEIVTGVI